jgi:hypothetical protein
MFNVGKIGDDDQDYRHLYENARICMIEKNILHTLFHFHYISHSDWGVKQCR